ncbi:hypothetical protein ACS0PU_000658 [Formica fusca]
MAEEKEVDVDIIDEDENIFFSKFSLEKESSEVEKESASYGFALANPMDQVATSVAAGPVAGASVASGPVAGAPIAAGPVAGASVATGPVAGAPIAAGPMAATPAVDRTAADRTATGRTAAAAGPIAANEPSVDSTWQARRPRGRAAGIRRQQEHFVKFLYQLSCAYYSRGNRGRGRGRGRGTI